MSELTQEKRDNLIEQLADVSARLAKVPDGPTRDDVKAELTRLVRLLWLDGKPDR